MYNASTKTLQLTSCWHRFILLSGLALICLTLAHPASAATCTLSEATATYSRSSSTPDTVSYFIDATADNLAYEHDEVILVISYYDVNKVLIGHASRYPVGSSGNECPVHGYRYLAANGKATTLDNVPSGTAKATYHYEINANVTLAGNVGTPSVSRQANTPEYIVFEIVQAGTDPPAP